MCKTIFSRIIRGRPPNSKGFADAFYGTNSIRKGRSVKMTIINKIALAIAIVGTLNWGLVGLFSFDLVAWLSGGPETILARIIYVAVALAGVWCISLLFRNEDEMVEHGV